MMNAFSATAPPNRNVHALDGQALDGHPLDGHIFEARTGKAGSFASLLALALTFLLLSLLAPSSALAAPAQGQGQGNGNPSVVSSDAVLGDDGTVYRVLGGPFGALFPDGLAGHDLLDATPVLALDVVPAEGEAGRWLVPGTDNDDLDGLPVMVYQATTDGLFLFWQSRVGAQANLHLIGFDSEGFGERVPVVTDGQVPRPGSAGLTVTQDRLPAVQSVEGDETAGAPSAERHVDRSVVHLVWWAETDHGEGAYYAPVVLEDGKYLGWHPVVPLTTLQPNGPPADSVGTGQTTAGSSDPIVQPGRDPWTVVIAFTDNHRKELVTAEARLLPGQLVSMAREAASYIERTDPGVEGVENLAEGIGTHLIEIGFWAHPSLRGYFANSARERLIELAYEWNAPAIPQDALGEKIGSHLIEIGSRYFGRDGFIDFDGTEPVHILSLRPDGAGSVDLLEEQELGLLNQTETPHLIRLYVVSRLPLPEAQGEDAEARVFVGDNGEKSLISWEEEGDIHYRESRGAEWSNELVLPLSSGIDRAQAYRLLSERVQDN